MFGLTEQAAGRKEAGDWDLDSSIAL